MFREDAEIARGLATEMMEASLSLGILVENMQSKTREVSKDEVVNVVNMFKTVLEDVHVLAMKVEMKSVPIAGALKSQMFKAKGMWMLLKKKLGAFLAALTRE
jgi:hypothetical protein